MKVTVKLIYIILVVVLFLPGKAFCQGNERKIVDKTAFSPYYDTLNDKKAPVKVDDEKRLVPESMEEKKAIGYGGDPGLHDGISFKYWFKKDMAVSVNAKLLLETEGGNLEHNINIRPKLLMNVSKSDILLINLFAGLDILFSDNIDHTSEGDWHVLYAIAGISPELFITENFSIETSFGAYLELLGGSSGAGGNNNTVSFGTLGDSISQASISFNIYF